MIIVTTCFWTCHTVSFLHRHPHSSCFTRSMVRFWTSTCSPPPPRHRGQTKLRLLLSSLGPYLSSSPPFRTPAQHQDRSIRPRPPRQPPAPLSIRPRPPWQHRSTGHQQVDEEHAYRPPQQKIRCPPLVLLAPQHHNNHLLLPTTIGCCEEMYIAALRLPVCTAKIDPLNRCPPPTRWSTLRIR